MYWKKAIPAATVGIAFFLISCQPRISIKEKRRAEESASALNQMAEIYFKAEEYGKALGLFKKISKEYPDYTGLSIVRYQIVRSLYLMGDHQGVRHEAIKWLEKHPRHSEKGHVLLILGKDFEAMGDYPQAFYWFLKAKKEYLDDLYRQGELNEKLEELIRACELEDIEQLSGYAAGSDYAPGVYHRMATVFLEHDELEKASEAAMSLIRSTQQESWVSAGMQILARIQEEMTVRLRVVGCLLPLSGPFAIYGEEVLNGIQLGMFSGPEQVPGLELVIKDTKDAPEHALAGLEDLVHNEKVMAIIGPLSSKTAVEVARRAQELGVPIITLSQKEEIAEEGDMVFRNFLTPSREVKRILDAAVGEMGIKRFGVLYPDNSYGRFFMNLFWDRIEEMGGMVTAAESYQPNKTDFADEIKKMTGVYYPKPYSLVEKIRKMRPPEEEESKIYPDKPEPFIDFDAVFIPDNFQKAAMIAPQLLYHDVSDVLLMGTSLWQSPQLIDMAGDYVQDAIFPSGFFERSGEPGADAFVEEYRASFGSAPGVLAAAGYDTIRLLNKVMGGEDIRTRKDIRNELLKCRDFKGVTGSIFFDPQGEVEKEPHLLTISGKRMRLFN
jgi:ABC-type branched-subunit amino acid transport system substrate-binding protein